MEHFTPIPAFLGGVLIGISSLLLLLLQGKIAGISGILERAALSFVRNTEEWAFYFFFGLILGGLILNKWNPSVFGGEHPHNLWLIGIGGLLVGFGTRLGSGCTSGHGVCGLGRLSVRSLVAVLVFMAVAMTTETILELVKG